MAEPPAALPVFLIGGFLGAGKTTLINALLAQADGRRFVVFVNDFGAINIDLDLVETVSEDRIALSNGCVCCSLNADFVATLAEFARRPDPPDAVMIEASGVADPRALEGSLGALEAARLVRLDLRLYLLDAPGFASLEPGLVEDIVDHAAASDLVLLNKADLAEPARLEAIEALLAEAAPYAQRLRSVAPDFPLALLLDRDPTPSRPQSTAARPAHETAFARWSAISPHPLDRAAFTDFARLLSARALRAKGLLRFADSGAAWQVFHLVGWRATLEACRPPIHGESRIVAIGLRDRLDPTELDEAFQGATCAASSSAPAART